MHNWVYRLHWLRHSVIESPRANWHWTAWAIKAGNSWASCNGMSMRTLYRVSSSVWKRDRPIVRQTFPGCQPDGLARRRTKSHDSVSRRNRFTFTDPSSNTQPPAWLAMVGACQFPWSQFFYESFYKVFTIVLQLRQND